MYTEIQDISEIKCRSLESYSLCIETLGTNMLIVIVSVLVLLHVLQYIATLSVYINVRIYEKFHIVGEDPPLLCCHGQLNLQISSSSLTKVNEVMNQ